MSPRCGDFTITIYTLKSFIYGPWMEITLRKKLTEMKVGQLIDIINDLESANSFVLKALKGRNQCVPPSWMDVFNPAMSMDVEFTNISRHLITAILDECKYAKRRL